MTVILKLYTIYKEAMSFFAFAKTYLNLKMYVKTGRGKRTRND